MTLKRQILTLFLLIAAGGVLRAQTLTQAKTWYENGDYEKAKPVFRRFVTSQPANGNYNLWYGVCCLQTGQAEESVRYIETAVRKRIPSGQLYLAQAYHAVYRFDDAVGVFEEYIAELTRRKRSTELADSLLRRSQMGAKLMNGVEEVCVVDSFVVDKASFLDVYRISPESGKLFTMDAYFEDNTETEGTVYLTEMGDRLYYAQRQANGHMGILVSNRTGDRWSAGTPLTGPFDEDADINYPYAMTDGVTLYYAANGEDSFGGYDIFVTRYSTATDSFLAPENIGMPFNSPYNDYMYVIDEFNNLGWFASDRYQPEGKVCVYVFIPNASKHVYDAANMPERQLINLARLQPISLTWKNRNVVNEVRQRLAEECTDKDETQQTYDFTFVVNDRRIYHYLDDFQSAQAKESFNKLRNTKRTLRQVETKLDNLRMEYQQVNTGERLQMAPSMLDLEKRINLLNEEIDRLTILVRQQELSY